MKHGGSAPNTTPLWPLSGSKSHIHDVSPSLFHVITELLNLINAAQYRKQFAFTEGTKSNHKTQIKEYKNFCQKHKLDSLNPSELIISAYIEHLAGKLTSFRSINNYISGVRFYLRYNRRSTASIDNFHVKLLLQACEMTVQSESRKKLDITFQQFKLLCKACDKMGSKGILLKVAICFCFYGMVRQSNVCPRASYKFHPNKFTARKCVTFQDPGLVLSLPWTKTRQAGGQPLLVPMPKLNDKSICPVQAYKNLIKLQPTVSQNQPLLAAKDGKSISCRLLTRWFKQALGLAGLPQNTISLHSLRRSAATIMAHSGVNIANIKTHADWKSTSSFWQYVSAQRPEDSVVAKALRALSAR